MKFATSALLGLLGGVGLVSLTAFTLLRPALWSTYKTTGLPTEYLAPGAAAWKVIASPPAAEPRLVALPGGELAALSFGDQAAVLSPSTLTWAARSLTVEPPLARRAPPGATPIFWTGVSPTEALAAYHDDFGAGTKRDPCQLFLEPEHAPLPVLPRCKEAAGATRLTRGTILALAWDGAAKQTFRLEPGSQAWQDAGPLPEDGNGELLSGANDRALYAGYGERIALFEGGGWKVLPQNVEPRYAYRFALADDGAVLIVGGQQDEAAAKTTFFALLPLLGLGAVGALAVVAKVKWKARVAGLLTGFGAALVLAALALVAALPLFAWH